MTWFITLATLDERFKSLLVGQLPPAIHRFRIVERGLCALQLKPNCLKPDLQPLEARLQMQWRELSDLFCQVISNVS